MFDFMLSPHHDELVVFKIGCKAILADRCAVVFFPHVIN